MNLLLVGAPLLLRFAGGGRVCARTRARCVTPYRLLVGFVPMAAIYHDRIASHHSE